MNDISEKWEELSIADDFLFGKVMRKPKLCKQMLETILDIEIERIEYPEVQKIIDLTKDSKGIRLDVYVKDENHTIYNVEIQTSDTKELPKRSRYYQGMIDLNLIEKGEYYKKLNKSYVIFICTFDLFERGRHLYTFENRCKQEPDLVLGDETTKIFLNTDSDMDDVSEDLRAFLDYIGGKKSENKFVKEMDDEVEKAKQNEEWRLEYMTLLMRDKENIEKGLEQGLEQGETYFAILTQKLLADNRTEDLIKATNDKEFLHTLYKEYNIQR